MRPQVQGAAAVAGGGLRGAAAALPGDPRPAGGCPHPPSAPSLRRRQQGGIPAGRGGPRGREPGVGWGERGGAGRRGGGGGSPASAQPRGGVLPAPYRRVEGPARRLPPAPLPGAARPAAPRPVRLKPPAAAPRYGGGGQAWRG